MNIPKFRYIKGTLYIDKETYNRDVMQVKEYKEDEIDRLNNIINKAIEYIDKCKMLSTADKKIILSISLLENILKGNKQC